MVLGIDLGTTNSSCAFYDGRDVVLIPNDRGSRVTPSVAALSEDGAVLVGESARNQALVNPGRTVSKAKRLMGSGRRISLGDRSIAPEEAASYILARLKADAEAYLNEEVREAVITVPAYFSEAQRRATREAGRLAGFEVKRLLNEPTAAAISWAWSVNRSFGEDPAERHVLVYDLGGGTFDATVLAMRGNGCRVLSACGDNELGGMDFDRDLFERAVSAFEHDYGLVNLRDDPVLRQQLWDLVEQAKIELSSRESASIVLPFAGTARGKHPSWKIERAEFESLISERIERTVALVEQALGEASRSIADVDRLVLSGGSSRIPLVRRRLKEAVGRDAEGRINPEEIVAFGAAVFAGLGAGFSDSLSVSDALSRSFGLEIDGDEFITVIPKNSPVPVSRKRMFTTIADGQGSVEIHVLQGESRKASENIGLGRFLLSGIRAGKKGEPRIEVEFAVDSDEILHVRARDVDTGVAHSVTIAAPPEAASGTGPERLRSLASRAEGLKAFAGSDRSLQTELEEALSQALRLASDLEAQAASESTMKSAAAAALTMQAIVAELEARRDAKG
jgi:molecular chaperone DnaK